MADTVIGALRVLLGLDTAAFSSGAKEAQGALSQLEKSVTGGLKNMAGALGVGLSIGAIVGQFKNAVNAADELFKASQKFGVGVESLSALKYAAELADVSFEALSKGLKKLAQSTTEALIKPNSEAAASFQTLGISMEELKGASPEQALLKVAEAFSKFDDDATKTTVAVNLFGKAGADLIPLLNQGAAGISKTTEEARKLGLIVSTDAAKGAEEFNDALKKLEAVSQGVANQILRDMLPALKAFSDAVDDLIKSGELSKFAKQVSGFFTSTLKEFTLLTTGISRGAAVIEAAFALIGNASAGDLEGSKNALERLKQSFDDFSNTVRDTDLKFIDPSDLASLLDAERAVNSLATTIKEKLKNEYLTAATEGGKLIESLRKQVEQHRAAKESVELSAGAQAAAKITAELFSISIDKNSDAFKNLKAQVDQYLPTLITLINQTQAAQSLKGMREQLDQNVAGLKAEIGALQQSAAQKQKLIDQERLREQFRQGKLGDDVKELNSIIERQEAEATLKDRIEAGNNTITTRLEIQRREIEGRIALRGAQGESIADLEAEKAAILGQIAAKQKGLDKDPEVIAAYMRQSESVRQATIDKQAYDLVISNRTPQEELIAMTQRHQDILAKYPALYRQTQAEAAKFANQQIQDEGKAISGLLTGMGQVFSALGAHNKKAFETSKAFNIAAAVMNSFLAFTQVLATSKLPPPFNYAAAAATLAVGLAQVIQIKNQKYTGAALGGSFMVPGGSMGVDTKLIPMHLAPGERVDVTPANQVGGAGEKILSIPSIRPKDFFTGDVVREMVFQIDEWVRDGGTGIRFVKQAT